MEVLPMRNVVLIVVWMYAFSMFGYVFSNSNPYPSESTCLRRRDSPAFLNDLNFQCPLPISGPSFPIEMDGDSIDRVLDSRQKDGLTAVLFYAEWCPFSRHARQYFSILSSMFPQIKHLMVEQSAAMPSVFSRYGIYGLPTIMVVNQTGMLQYHGCRDLPSLVNFYQETTGLYPVVDLTENQNYVEEGPESFMLWSGASLKEMLRTDPYLVLSVAFVLFRAILYIFPEMASRAMALWAAYIPHLNMGIFGESRQLLHLIDVKRVWSKLKLCKTRNFHQGARNARVWASSLTSVSLGKASSSRLSPSED